MNLNQSQTRYAGIALITLGVVAVFNLWGLIPVVLVGGAGAMIYQRQRAIGRTSEAFQAGLWGIGLAFLLLIDFLIPGVLLLGGLSLLLRGRELEADQRLHSFIGGLTSRRSAPVAPSTPSIPAAPVSAAPSRPTNVTVVNNEQPNTSETVRLR